MATTQNLYTGNGATVLYSFTFPYIDVAHIKVTLDGVATTAYTLANATTVQFNTAPANGVVIRIYRDTAIEAPEAVFYKGSAIRASDLNDNFTQELYKAQEDTQYMVTTDGENPFIGPPDLGGFKITNVGTPTAGTDAATKAYADLKVAKAGDSMTGPLAMGGNKVTGVGTPTAGTDAATKGYVDDLLPGHQAQADAAAASEAAAAASASAAATSYDSFDDRYLGAKVTDPSVDNDGGALIVGAIYFNTTLDQMRVFNGTSWQDASASTALTRFKFTAVGGETSLSGEDDDSQSLTYNVGLELVYLNGALLARGIDYTATTGSSITGLVALTAADFVEIIALSQIDVVGSIPSANSTFLQSGTGAVQRTVDSKLKDVFSVKDFGAVGDGVADDTAEIQATVTAADKQAVILPKGTYNVSGAGTNTWPALFSLGGAGIVKSGGGFYPRSYYNLSAGPQGSTIYGYKNLAPGDYGNPPGYGNPFASQVYLQSVSQGATSPYRGLVAQVTLESSSLNNGSDHYNLYCGMGVYQNQTPGITLTSWGDQNSAGLTGGQVNALTGQTNLYGTGDVSLVDNGLEDVSLLGSVYFTYYEGTESGNYAIPRIIHLGTNLGSKYIDAIFAGTGKTYVGLDLSRTTTSGAAIALSDNQKIAWNATTTVPYGKFTTQNVGTALTFYQSGYYYFQDASLNVSTFKYSDSTFYGGNSTAILRAQNTTNSKSVSLGVIGDYGYVGGLGGSGDCGLIFRTTSGGVSNDRVIIGSNTVLPASDNSLVLGFSSQRWQSTYSTDFRPGAGTSIWTSGAGTPEGAVAAPVGSMYTRTDGGAGTTLYVKESGTGNTGWVAK